MRLQKEFPSVNLGFSLHSPFPEQRFKLMPITASYPISDVMSALKNYVKQTNKRVLIAYVLLANVNDSLDHAKALARLIKNQGAKSYLFEVKLIRFNTGPTKENFSATPNAKIHAFQKVLDDFGIKNTLRQNFGIGISAACGQLSAGYINNIQLPSSVL
jgi:23S rRNA (adenine-C8)-methyltransferase